MKNLYKVILILTIGILSTTGCDDYVNIDPEYTIDADNYFLAPEDYDRALTGAYDLLQMSYLTLWIGEIASDNAIAGGESFGDSQGLHEIENMTHGGVNAELRSVWRYMYAGVTRANFIFVNKDNIDFSGKDEILAQAAFLRAYYYFELVKFFGDVPLIVDQQLSISDVSGLERTPSSEVYAQIEEDLIYASGILGWSANQKGRITKGAALALLGKAYLYQDKFAEAAATLDEVINDGPYSLVADYSSMFRVSNEGSSESVFEIEYVGSEGGSYDCFVCLEGFAAVGFQGIRGYQGPIYVDGNSYNLPTQDLADAFEANDPRLEASLLDIEAFVAEQTVEVTYTEGAGGHTGYYNKKYLKREDELGQQDTDLTSPVNYRVIRYADVLLMAAEAHNRKASADDATAIEYLNLVRSRVGMPEVMATGTDLTEAIYHERRVELSGEGLRFFDLVRTGKAASEIEGFTSNKNELFPIPQDEIDLAGAGWLQNQGYN